MLVDGAGREPEALADLGGGQAPCGELKAGALSVGEMIDLVVKGR